MNQSRKLSDQDSWLAAEYALGVLSGKQMADAELKAVNDQNFRAAVEGWNNQLSPMLESVDEVQPPSSVWSNLESKLQPAPTAKKVNSDGIGFWKLVSAFTSTVAVACVGMLMYFTGGDFGGNELAEVKQELVAVQDKASKQSVEMQGLVEQLQTSENTLLAEREKLLDVNERVTGLEQQLDTVTNELTAETDRLADATSELASLQDQLSSGQLALQTVQEELETTQQALDAANQQVALVNQQVREARPLVASLTQSGDAPAFVAQFDPLKQALLIRTEVADNDAKVPEVWLIPAQGDRQGEVLSLGVMDETAPDTLPISEDFIGLIGEGGTLAITMEPPGGAPNGVATGPVIALGKLQSF